MKLKLEFGALSIVGTVISALLIISVFHEVDSYTLSVPRAKPKPSAEPIVSKFSKKMGAPLPPSRRRHTSATKDSAEDESDENDNESQARVEPQITPLNRDYCLAKLLCGMSVPVTGTGAPKNGYYSQYASVVGSFFEAFPLEDEENKSAESIEAYDDYSVEESIPTTPIHKKKPEDNINNKPARQNSKLLSRNKVIGGLQLIDLAMINKAASISDEERNARRIDLRIQKARKIVNKLGEKLHTVRQCQQIAGCPFTFKQLRSKLKSTPSVSVPSTKAPLAAVDANFFENTNLDFIAPIKYTYNTNGYKPTTKTKPKPTSTQVSLGSGPQDNLPYADSQKGDDELEEFFGPPPVFGSSGRPAGYQSTQQNIKQTYTNENEEYQPYNPPIRRPNSKAQVHSGSPFPKNKVEAYPSFVKRKPSSGQNDEFDDVNQSTGPISLIDGDDQKQRPPTQVPQYEGQYEGQNEEKVSQKEKQKEEEESEDDASGSDEDYEDEYEDEENSSEEEEKPVKVDKKKKKPENEDIAETTTSKIKKYKNPTAPLVLIEGEFPAKKNNEDDELDHPDNAWTKLAFATSSAVVKEPKNKNKTALEMKNNEKLNLSKESSAETEDKDKDKDNDNEEYSEEYSSEDEEEETNDETEKSRNEEAKKEKTSVKKVEKVDAHDDEIEEEKSRNKRPSKNKSKTKPKLSLTDEDEFDKVTASASKSKSTTKKSTSKSKKTKKTTTALKGTLSKAKRKKNKKEKPQKDDNKSEEKMSGYDNAPVRQPLLEIGGRPLLPNPGKNKQKSKKTSGLSRFKFSLVRPYGAPAEDEEQPAKSPQRPSYSSYSKPSSSSSNSFRNGLSGSGGGSKSKDHSPPYIPSTPYNGHLSPNQDNNSNKPPPNLITFPFSPFSTLKTLFKRPGFSSRNNADMPELGNGAPSAPVSTFIKRPVGPESNNFKRNPNRRSDFFIRTISNKNNGSHSNNSNKYSHRFLIV